MSKRLPNVADLMLKLIAVTFIPLPIHEFHNRFNVVIFGVPFLSRGVLHITMLTI